MDIDKINAALKVRDEKLASAHSKHTKKVVELNDEFAKQQQALAAGFAAEEQKSVEEANAEIDAAIKAFDKALADLAEEDMKDLNPSPIKKTDNSDKTGNLTLTAEDISKRFTKVELASFAKDRGLKVSAKSSEMVIIKDLLADGWAPSA
jgi:hypothetical protein